MPFWEEQLFDFFSRELDDNIDTNLMSVVTVAGNQQRSLTFTGAGRQIRLAVSPYFKSLC